jgi:uncharacterized protein YuzE
MAPTVRYDPEADAFAVRLGDRPVARTVVVDDAHYVDLDADGNVVKIEVLTPKNPQIESIAERFGIADQTPAILVAIEEALPHSLSVTSPSLLVVLDQATFRALQYSVVPAELTPSRVVASGAVRHLQGELEQVG